MRARLPRIGLAAVMVGLSLGCQAGEGPTDVDRSLETSRIQFDYAPSEVYEAAFALLPESSARFVVVSLNLIAALKVRYPETAKAKGQDLIDYVNRQFERRRFVDHTEGRMTGSLVLGIAEYVGLVPPTPAGAEVAATTCVKGKTCTTKTSTDHAGTQIPGGMVNQTFTIYMIKLPNDADPFGPRSVPFFYEIGTIPAGITFPSQSTSGSLSLSAADDHAVAGICILDEGDPQGVPAGAVAGVDYVLAHLVNGRVEVLDPVPVDFLDCEGASSSGQSANRWTRPLGLALQALGPDRLYAKGTGLGTAISSFSPYGGYLLRAIPTTTTAAIVGGGSTFHTGDTIRIRARVDPTPSADEGPQVVFRVLPQVGGAPVEPVVNGTAEHAFVCGSAAVPHGSHTAGAAFLGTDSHELSLSGQVLAFSCQP